MMFPKLKYIYYISIPVICLAASSCETEAPRNDKPEAGAEVRFDVDRATRASAAPAIEKFAVYGDKVHPADNVNPPSLVFNKTEVEYKNGSWSYEGVQYWFPKHEHSFVAIAPVSALETSGTPQYSNSQLSFTYILPATEDHQVTSLNDIPDIIVATHRRLYDEADVNTTTTFRFGHILSQINLASALDDNIMKKDECIKIHQLELSGFKTKATFTVLPAPRQSNSQTDDRVIEVGGQETEGSMTVKFAEPVIVANDRAHVSLFGAGEAIRMLPQSFTADSEAKFIMTYTINDDPKLKQAILPLQNQKWESGRSYTYKFTITRTGVIVDTTAITDWDEATVGNINAY